MPEKELPRGKGRRPELAGDSESNERELTRMGRGGRGAYRLAAEGILPADLRRFSQMGRGMGRGLPASNRGGEGEDPRKGGACRLASLGKNHRWTQMG